MSFLLRVILSVIIGIFIGILTVLGQGILPGSWNYLANSGTVWLLPSFFIGALGSTKIRAVRLSILSIFGMVAGYYGYSMLVQDVSHSIYYILVWFGTAVVGGIIFGLGGFLWKRENGFKHRFGSSLIGGVFITQGLDIFIHINDYRHMLDVGIVQIVIGLLLLLFLERTNKERISSLFWLLPVVILGIVGYQLLHLLT